MARITLKLYEMRMQPNFYTATTLMQHESQSGNKKLCTCVDQRHTENHLGTKCSLNDSSFPFIMYLKRLKKYIYF